MDRAWSKDAVTDQQSVRDRMRARAREQTGGERGPYLTPQWLDHSFVLPANGEPGTVALPSPRAESPVSERPDEPVFERPATPEIDFMAVVRRADLGRQARIVTGVALVVALVAVVLFQVTSQPVAAICAVFAAVAAVVAAAWRIVLNRAPVPYLEA